MIGSIRGQTMTTTGGSSAATTSNATTRAARGGQEPAATAETGKTATDGSSTQKLSTLARQMADSAARAEERDRTLNRKELAAKAASIVDQTWGDAYFRNKAKHDSEVPNTDDPELLARARQATEFVNNEIHQRHGVKNPFASLSDEQLALIAYDDSGPYTTNERYAASSESDHREQAWRQKVCAQAQVEYENTGKHTNFFKECIEHYKGLPLMEQVQYPENYVSFTTWMMNAETDDRPHFANHAKSKDGQSLYELLLETMKKKEKKEEKDLLEQLLLLQQTR